VVNVTKGFQFQYSLFYWGGGSDPRPSQRLIGGSVAVAAARYGSLRTDPVYHIGRFQPELGTFRLRLGVSGSKVFEYRHRVRDRMRRFLAAKWNCAEGSASALLALLLVTSSPETASADELDPGVSVTALADPSSCNLPTIIYENLSTPEPTCPIPQRTPAEISSARAYVVDTATPGYTMTLQGPELAVARLHPEFVVRLANAVREARNAGLAFAGIFSAYRAPAFGVGGFRDKFNSLHTYGLAVDVYGIGKPGSNEAQLWHEIAARNGVVCPYGPQHRAEWNHCQPTSVKIVVADNPLRETVTADGPSDLGTMFEAGNHIIQSMASAAEAVFTSEPISVRLLEAAANGTKESAMQAKRTSRASTNRAAGRSVRRVKLGARVGARRTPLAVEAGSANSRG
jgi:hypothetical protein